MATVGVHRVVRPLSGRIERWMPNPFMFALLLTYVVFVGGLVIEGKSATQMLGYWNDGLWGLLKFSMQMVLIIGTGYVLAYHPWVQRRISWLAQFPSNSSQAAVLIGFVAMVAAWFHWGLGLITGAVFARELGYRLHKRGTIAHYPLLCVAGYMGLGLTWHWGLSGSATLIMNTPNNTFIGQGVVDGVLSPTQTVFHPYTLTLLLVSVIATLVILYVLSPSPSDAKPITEYIDIDRRRNEHISGGNTHTIATETAEETDRIPAERIDQSRIIGGLVASGGIAMIVVAFAVEGFGALRINTINSGLLFLGLALYTRPDAYQEEFYNAVRSAAGVILLFPFYAGIIGMMNLSGLSTTMTEWMLGVATAETFPVIAWLAAGVVNVFVPSGGGQWTLMGVEVLNRAQELGVPPGKAVIAFGAGDAYTNLLQPFWAIPLLGITGIRARELFGYAIIVMVLPGPILAIALVAIPY